MSLSLQLLAGMYIYWHLFLFSYLLLARMCCSDSSSHGLGINFLLVTSPEAAIASKR